VGYESVCLPILPLNCCAHGVEVGMAQMKCIVGASKAPTLQVQVRQQGCDKPLYRPHSGPCILALRSRAFFMSRVACGSYFAVRVTVTLLTSSHPCCCRGWLFVGGCWWDCRVLSWVVRLQCTSRLPVCHVSAICIYCHTSLH
jgi:hypothetical protein